MNILMIKLYRMRWKQREQWESMNASDWNVPSSWRYPFGRQMFPSSSCCWWWWWVVREKESEKRERTKWVQRTQKWNKGSAAPLSPCRSLKARDGQQWMSIQRSSELHALGQDLPLKWAKEMKRKVKFEPKFWREFVRCSEIMMEGHGSSWNFSGIPRFSVPFGLSDI